jgi:hypothetical protein
LKTITATIERFGTEFDVDFQYEIEPGEKRDRDYPGSDATVLIYTKEKLSESEYSELERVVWENEK